MPAGTVLDTDAIRRAGVHHTPYDYIMGHGALREEWIPALRESFPDIAVTGFHPLSQMTVDGAFAQLIAEIEGPEFTAAVSDTLGLDLRPFPQLITVRKVSAAHEGRIHCDSESKLATLLIYMNEGWLPPEGRFRVLRSQNSFDDFTAEVSPEMGTFVAFRRADHSWHGHTPFVGERRVVQVAWVRSQADIDRKTSRHNLSTFFKNLWKPERAQRQAGESQFYRSPVFCMAPLGPVFPGEEQARMAEIPRPLFFRISDPLPSPPPAPCSLFKISWREPVSPFSRP